MICQPLLLFKQVKFRQILNQQKHANALVIAIPIDAVARKIIENAVPNATVIKNQNVKIVRPPVMYFVALEYLDLLFYTICLYSMFIFFFNLSIQ